MSSLWGNDRRSIIEVLKAERGSRMHRWLLYRIPLAVYILALIGMFFMHPFGALIVAGISLFFAVPWMIIAKWICREIDKSNKFNHRKRYKKRLKERFRISIKDNAR